MAAYGERVKILSIRNSQGGGNLSNQLVFPIPNHQASAESLYLSLNLKFNEKLTTKTAPTTNKAPFTLTASHPAGTTYVDMIRYLYAIIKQIKMFAGDEMLSEISGLVLFEYLCYNVFSDPTNNQPTEIPYLFIDTQDLVLEFPWFNYNSSKLIDLSEFRSGYFKIVIDMDGEKTNYNKGISELFPYIVLDTKLNVRIHNNKYVEKTDLAEYWMTLNSDIFDLDDRIKQNSTGIPVAGEGSMSALFVFATEKMFVRFSSTMLTKNHKSITPENFTRDLLTTSRGPLNRMTKISERNLMTFDFKLKDMWSNEWLDDITNFIPISSADSLHVKYEVAQSKVPKKGETIVHVLQEKIIVPFSS